MTGKIFASIILISVLYAFGVFFAPNLADSVAGQLGILSVNTTLRQLKDSADSSSTTLLQIKDASGAINSVKGVVNGFNDTINKTTETVNTLRQTGEQTVQKVEKTVDSVKKAGEAIDEVKSNLNSLTDFSGSASSSGELSLTGSGQ